MEDAGIFQRGFAKKILEANTKQKAKRLAEKISHECEAWRKMFKEHGHKEGAEEMRKKFRDLLDIEKHIDKIYNP